MGLFNRKNTTERPAAIVPASSLRRLAEVGRIGFQVPAQFVDVSDFYLDGFLRAGSPGSDSPEWDAFVDRFASELSSAANQQGGWAVAGAFYVAIDFVGGKGFSRPELASLMDSALRFLKDRGIDSSMVPTFALARWNELAKQ